MDLKEMGEIEPPPLKKLSPDSLCRIDSLKVEGRGLLGWGGAERRIPEGGLRSELHAPATCRCCSRDSKCMEPEEPANVCPNKSLETVPNRPLKVFLAVRRERLHAQWLAEIFFKRAMGEGCFLAFFQQGARPWLPPADAFDSPGAS